MKTAHMHQSEPEENVAENGWELVVEGRNLGYLNLFFYRLFIGVSLPGHPSGMESNSLFFGTASASVE
jgi:hypothetical protein